MRLLLLLTIFGLLMVIATVPEVRATSIKCFKCNSDKDKNCKDKTRLTATVSCKVGCFEATLQYETKSTVIRGCDEKNKRHDLEKKSGVKKVTGWQTCHTDQCNAIILS